MPDNTKINAPTKTDPGKVAQSFGPLVRSQAVEWVYTRSAGRMTAANRTAALALAIPTEPDHGDVWSAAAQKSREQYATGIWETVLAWIDANTVVSTPLIELARKSNPYDSTPER